MDIAANILASFVRFTSDDTIPHSGAFKWVQNWLRAGLHHTNTSIRWAEL